MSDKKEPSDSESEQILKNTALTFSIEGINNDLKILLDKKIHLLNSSFKSLALLSSKKDSEDILKNEYSALSKKKSPKEKQLPGGDNSAEFKKLLKITTDEFKLANVFLNRLISVQIDNEVTLLRDLGEENNG
jgi:hypothetical protein